MDPSLPLPKNLCLVQRNLTNACLLGDLKTFLKIVHDSTFELKKNPSDLMRDACRGGNLDIIKGLLRLAGTGAANRDHPLMVACFNNHLWVVRLLLADPEICLKDKPALRDMVFNVAVARKNVAMVEFLICHPKMESGKLHCVGWNQRDQGAEMSALMYDFARHPQDIRQYLVNRGAADLFVLMVLWTDGYLRWPTSFWAKATGAKSQIMRFFQVSARLPLELQMLLARRAFWSARDFISGVLTEVAFRKIFRFFESLSPPPPSPPKE